MIMYKLYNTWVMGHEVQITELRSNLRDILDQVRAGETITVLHYSKPIAQITPYEEPVMEAVTADHITDLYNADVTDNHNRCAPVLARDHDGGLIVCHNPTPENHGWDVIYTKEQLTDWLADTDLGEGEAETIAEQINADLNR